MSSVFALIEFLRIEAYGLRLRGKRFFMRVAARLLFLRGKWTLSTE